MISSTRDYPSLSRALPLMAFLAVATSAHARPVQGGSTICEPPCDPNPVCVFYPQGTLSFADFALRYDPLAQGGPAPAVQFQDPSAALGVPNTCGGPDALTLGNGGLVELAFTDNLLSNGGTPQDPFDLWVYEIGPNVETMDVWVRATSTTLPLLDPALDPDGDGYFHVARIAGQPSAVDIDLTFLGYSPGTIAFDAVRIQDALNVNQSTGASVGADIDAVGAINSVPPVSIQAYCFGTGCPCNNDDPTAGCQNSTGGGGLLSATGSPSFANDDLVLTAQGLRSGARGFVFMGPLSTQAPFGNGLRCVAPGPRQVPPGTGMFRFPMRIAVGGAFAQGPGLIAYSQAHFGVPGTILQGTTWHFQTHYRDPAGPCGSPTNLTNAVSVTFQ